MASAVMHGQWSSRHSIHFHIQEAPSRQAHQPQSSEKMKMMFGLNAKLSELTNQCERRQNRRIMKMLNAWMEHSFRLSLLR
jgi:hypothetical protein